ncbi:hypothetical protein PR003_g12362 [Phytophthora rubi]|uniref:RxLR effector protein n=1 Tax=Phytophthora rubi TaxID=129364 RepID=A0A6A3M898_9STRA|nr:hypothetical protein PR001_g11718 [Phytophthora rubi]KAE9336710.1 hypothetical protein PR003_g12362 [Phytophthora rubi]
MRLAFFLALIVATFVASSMGVTSAEETAEINNAVLASHTEPSDSNIIARRLRGGENPSDEERVVPGDAKEHRERSTGAQKEQHVTGYAFAESICQERRSA